MPRQLRLEYKGAVYHVMARGNRRESIYREDGDRLAWLDYLGQACQRTGWESLRVGADGKSLSSTGGDFRS
jgi:putative transposase